MISRVRQSLKRSDERFLTIIREPCKREEHLRQLRHSRFYFTLLLYAVALVLGPIVIISGIILGNIDMGTLTFLLLIVCVGYLLTDYRIKLLYVIGEVCRFGDVDGLEEE